MHELSIALSMIDIATEEVARRGSARVTALHIRLGLLSGVVKEALLFSYEVATNRTMLEGSRLLIEAVPVVIYCSECLAERTLESIQRFCCPVCGSLSSELVQGRELEFVAMEIEEIEEIGKIDERNGEVFAEPEALDPLRAIDRSDQFARTGGGAP